MFPAQQFGSLNVRSLLCIHSVASALDVSPGVQVVVTACSTIDVICLCVALVG